MRIKYLYKKYKHLLFAKHYKAHGIHSPFMFSFLTNIIFDKKTSKDYSKIESRKTFPLSSTKKKYGRLLFRIVKYYLPKNILEIYSSSDSYSQYLSSENTISNIYRANYNFDESNNLNSEKQANSIFSNSSKIIETKLATLLKSGNKFDIIFINKLKSYDKKQINIDNLLSLTNSDTIIIINFIHLSEESELFWKEIKRNSNVRQSLDLFEFGILFFKTCLHKEDFIVKPF